MILLRQRFQSWNHKFVILPIALYCVVAIVHFSPARIQKYPFPIVHLQFPILNVSSSAGACDPHSPPFFTVASSFNTDKTHHAPHHYEDAYQAHLAPLRCGAKSMLEIGLGCGISYGAGHSVPLWLSYLPSATISIFEFGYPCVVDFLEQNPLKLSRSDFARLHVFTGDQSDPDALLRAAAATGPFDVIVDDGGHSMLQQLVSLSVLLSHVKPGGVYILEDLATSFLPSYKDFPLSTVAFVGQVLECLHASPLGQNRIPPPTPRPSDARIADPCDLAKLIESVSCFEEVCVFTRWAKGASESAHVDTRRTKG